MAAQHDRQGDEEGVTGLAEGDSVDRVDELEAALERTERQLEAVVDRYEHVLATRERLRRDTGPDETFVWTDRDGEPTATLFDRFR